MESGLIGRPSKHPKLVNGLKLYLAEAQANSALPLTILAICRAIGVQKSTLYLHQHEPDVAELLSSIRALAKARKVALNHADDLSDVGDGGASNPDTAAASVIAYDANQSNDVDVLATRSAGAVQRAVWSMSRFMGRHRKHRYVSDLPRVVFDLDSTLAQLRQIREELSSLSDDWIQISQNDNEIISEGGQLSLSCILNEQG
jgi:hypothetical protein